MNFDCQRLLIICGLLMSWAPAYAYIDPGTGSALIGAIAAAFAAIVAFTKLYWHRFIGLFSRKKTEDSLPQDKHESDE